MGFEGRKLRQKGHVNLKNRGKLAWGGTSEARQLLTALSSELGMALSDFGLMETQVF